MSKRIELLREHYAPKWDDVHEARLLQRVLDEAKRPPRRERRVWHFAAIGAGVVAVAAGTFLLLGPSIRSHQVPSGSQVSAKVEPTPSLAKPPKSSVLKFVDGSLAVLQAGASVNCEHQSAESVRLSQASGSVHYEVHPNPARPFVIQAKSVRVEVVGTAFDISVGDTVAVQVTRGRVRVVDGVRTVELGPGEAIEVMGVNAGSQAIPNADTAKKLAPPPETQAVREANPKSSHSVEGLLREADEARRTGNSALAAEKLASLVSEFPNDARTASAMFTLARVEESRGRHARAAELFAQIDRRAPKGALAEDALAGQARAHQNAGNLAQAQAAARKYLERYPFGPHAARMRQVVE